MQRYCKSKTIQNKNDFIFISEREELCDFIFHDTYLPHQSMKSLWQYLEEDIRFEMDELATFDVRIIEACAKLGRKKNILNNLILIIFNQKIKKRLSD